MLLTIKSSLFHHFYLNEEIFCGKKWEDVHKRTFKQELKLRNGKMNRREHLNRV